MKLGPITSVREIRHAHMFCGVGVGARGFNLAAPRVGNVQARFVCVGGIDVDPGCIRNFERMTGVPGTVLDLFSRDQYIAFHGKEPPAGWKEATPADIRRAYGPKRPDVVFLSAPCKGFSGLLSATQSKTDKYQALNGLTLRGVWLLLEAYRDDPIPIILFENVPRILTRGTLLMDQIDALYRAAGYSVTTSSHDCGVIGNLAQSRKRALKIARHMTLVPPFVYQPRHHRLRGVGEVIGKLPLPGDPAAGAMHRVPALQWKTWVRLAFVPAGKDWRALNDLVVVDGALRDFGIVPEGGAPQKMQMAPAELRSDALGVNRWGDTAPVITTQRAPGQGRFSVADPRVDGAWQADVLEVRSWGDYTGVVAGRSSPSNGAYSVADPRGPVVNDAEGRKRPFGKYPVTAWQEAAAAVIGGNANSAYGVADPRPGYKPATHQNILAVVSFDAPAKSITSARHVAGGALSVADPRPTHGDNAHTNKMKVVGFEQPAPTVTTSDRVGSGALSVADPRPTQSNQTFRQYGVQHWTANSVAVSGQSLPGGGPYAVADPRPGYGAATHRHVLGVNQWGGKPTGTISGDAKPTTGAYAVSDPRLAGTPRFNNVFRIVPFDTAAPAVAGPGGPAGGLSVADPRPEGKENYTTTKYKVTRFEAASRAVIGASTTGDGAFAVADPRAFSGKVDRGPYQGGGHYGVVGWRQTGHAVPGSANHDNGFNSVADPREVELASDACRLPAPDDRLVCRIISTDGTWHRPFTTLDLAALQSLFDPEECFALEDGRWIARNPFDLDATSDVTKREWIGNAVPGAAATGMAETIGETILLADMGETFMLDSREIWVKPLAMALAVDNDQAAFRLDDGAQEWLS